MSLGHNRERQLRKLLEDAGWFVIRAPGSLGVADLCALKAGEQPRLIESKATKAGPYSGFVPADRQALLDAAEKAGARAELAWWPKYGSLTWIDSSAWPENRRDAAVREMSPLVDE